MISTECVVSSAKEHTVETTHSLVKKETTTENCGDTTFSKPDSSYVHKLTSLQLILTWINVKLKDSVTVTQELLDCIPTNTNSGVTYKWIKENMISESVMGHTSDGNDGNESDTAILYRKDDELKNSYKCIKAKPKRHKKQKRKNESTPPQVSFNVEVIVHGIHHRRHTYSLICKVQRCGKKFSNVRDWNSSYRDDIYSHHETQYKCQQCDCNFPFLSSVKNHQRVHLKQKLFKCFAGGCKSAFKHPQDLHRHIAKHIEKRYTCNKCGHFTYQRRLLKWHQVVHQQKYKYKCGICLFKSKYKWSLDCHWKTHK